MSAQIYDLNTLDVKFDFEVYVDMEYTKCGAHVHAFEMEDFVAGFLFCNEAAADEVFAAVTAALPRSVNMFDAIRAQTAEASSVKSRLKRFFSRSGTGKEVSMQQPKAVSDKRSGPTYKAAETREIEAKLHGGGAGGTALAPATTASPGRPSSGDKSIGHGAPRAGTPASSGTSAVDSRGPRTPTMAPAAAPDGSSGTPPHGSTSTAPTGGGKAGSGPGGNEDWLKTLRHAGIRKSQLLDPNVVAALAGVLAEEKGGTLPPSPKTDAPSPAPLLSSSPHDSTSPGAASAVSPTLGDAASPGPSAKARVGAAMRRLSRAVAAVSAFQTGRPSKGGSGVVSHISPLMKTGGERVLEEVTKDVAPALAARKVEIVKALELVTAQGGFKLKPAAVCVPVGCTAGFCCGCRWGILACLDDNGHVCSERCMCMCMWICCVHVHSLQSNVRA